MSAYVDPAMQPILERLRAGPAVDYRSMPMSKARALFEELATPWNEDQPAPAHVDDLSIPGADCTMRARLYRDANDRPPVILFAHGGGWTFGSIDSHDGTMRRLAIESGCAVLGFDYRLAPEHPFPAPLNDALAALEFVERGGLGRSVDETRIALAGDSAGANLALGAMLARRDRGEPLPRTAALFYGCYEPQSTSASHRVFGDGSYLLSTINMDWYWANFLGPALRNPHPIAAPRAASLAGLPPLYLNAAGLDPLLDDTLDLCRKLANAGVQYRFDHWPGVVHGFMRMSRELPAARAAIVAAANFLRAALSADQSQKKCSVGRDNHGTKKLSEERRRGRPARHRSPSPPSPSRRPVRWWYHFDNPQNSPADLVAKFEKENPGIKMQAEPIPWGGGNDYQTRLFAAIVAGNAPDCAMVRLSWAARFSQMKALEPLDDRVTGWRRAVGHRRQYLEDQSRGRRQAILPPAAVCRDLSLLSRRPVGAGGSEAADDLRGIPRRGEGADEGRRRPASACAAARAASTIGARSCLAAAQASRRAAWSPKRRWRPTAGTSISRARTRSFPPSAPTDSFRQIVDAFKAGRTAMTIHHVGSSNEMVQRARRQGVGGAGSARPGWQRLDLFRRRVRTRSSRRAAEQGRGVQMDLVPRLPATTTSSSTS